MFSLLVTLDYIIYMKNIFNVSPFQIIGHSYRVCWIYLISNNIQYTVLDILKIILF